MENVTSEPIEGFVITSAGIEPIDIREQIKGAIFNEILTRVKYDIDGANKSADILLKIRDV